MPDISGINYNGVRPRPTYEELINFEDYPIKYPDRTATFIRDSPLLTQLDGLGMMELEEMEQKNLKDIKMTLSDRSHRTQDSLLKFLEL